MARVRSLAHAVAHALAKALAQVTRVIDPALARVVVPALALLIPAGGARAECAMIQPFVCPCATDSVPPNPRLTLFWPRGLPPRAPALLIRDAQGRGVAHRLERLSSADAYDAYAVHVTAAAGTRFTVTAGPEQPGLSSTYVVDGAWSRPPAPAFDYRVETSSYEWACSFERTRTLSLPTGAASVYRIEWRPDGESGPWRSLVVPAHAAWFFSLRHPRGERDRLALGHVNCAGWNFRWDDAAIVVRVRALFPDGGEGDASPPVRLEAPPRLSGPRGWPDTPADLRSLESAWQSLLSALRSGRPETARAVCTPAGWDDLRRALGSAPARLTQAGDGWSATAMRWLPNGERRGEGRWGPEIKEHAFRFVRDGDEWRLDGYAPGE